MSKKKFGLFNRCLWYNGSKIGSLPKSGGRENDNVQKYLQASDVFSFLSLSEGLSNAVLEAMECRLLLSLANILQHREIIDKNFDIGDLFVNEETSG